jgi:glycosyltransferase involved in cell wall biosynthesis
MSIELKLVSVVIPNYNYGCFLAEAIDSALALDWPAVEVVVVDDGSTDNSREVIARYGSRIRAIFQENAGQCVACNAGFLASRGGMVIFLDSDDVLEPCLIRELAAVWRANVSKVQVQMRVIDAKGRPTGALFPQYQRVPTPEDIRAWALETESYPTPPGSGNAYSREFLERIMPVQGRDRASDSYYLAAAPFLGDVLTVPKPLVRYRIHGSNDGAMLQLEISKFHIELERARWRSEYARSIANSVGMRVHPCAFYRSLAITALRVASFRLAPIAHPLPSDTATKVIWDAVRAQWAQQGWTLPSRLILLAWCLAVFVSPRPVSVKLVFWRFSSGSRPRILRSLLNAFRVTGRTIRSTRQR